MGGEGIGASVVLHLSDDGGDNYRVRAHLVVLDQPVVGDTGGLWTMWRKRTLVVDAMQTLDGLGIHFPADDDDIEHIQEVVRTAFGNANPEHACYLDLVATIGKTNMTAAGSLDVVSTSFPTAFQWNNYLHEQLHATSSAHELGTFHAVGANYLVAYFTNMVGGTADNAPDAGIAHGYLTTDQQMLNLEVQVDKVLVHEIGHLTGGSEISMNYDHSPEVREEECAFSRVGQGACQLSVLPICPHHVVDVRRGVVRAWAPHAQDEIRRSKSFDSPR